jgi:hypothetical protein
MPENFEAEFFDPHEKAGISEILPSPEGMKNVAAEILEEERNRVENKIGENERNKNVYSCLTVLALATLFADLPPVRDFIQTHQQSGLDLSLDVFETVGLKPYQVILGNNFRSAIEGVNEMRLEKKLKTLNARIKKEKSKMSLSHGAE